MFPSHDRGAIGEIHINYKDSNVLEDEVGLRTKVTKQIIFESMLEGCFNVAWDTNDVFKQIKEKVNTTKLEKDYSKNIKNYIASFDKTLTKISKKRDTSPKSGKNKFKFSEYISYSLQKKEGKAPKKTYKPRTEEADDLLLRTNPKYLEGMTRDANATVAKIEETINLQYIQKPT